MQSVRALAPSIHPGFRAAVSALFLVAATAAVADPVYLVGAQVYGSGEVGENRAGDYQYSTNSSTSHYDLLITDSHGASDGSAIALALGEGANVFSFAFQSASVPTSIIGLNLFFSGTNTPFDPAYSTTAIPGDLTVFAVAGGVGFGVPDAGTDVKSFNDDGTNPSILTSYSGATTFHVGDEEISVTAFSATREPSGTFTLAVRPTAVGPVPSAVPEPASIALLGIGIAGLGASRLRRRRPA